MTRAVPVLALLTLLATTAPRHARASEFPERECCDPIYPIPEPTSKAPSAPTPTGRSGSDIKLPGGILNCLRAHQQCSEDMSCSAILEIIPRVCGPEIVACSTVTVTKCKTALLTLAAFPFFRPTCLCMEPTKDPDCNRFRDFLFDHPCILGSKKENELLPQPIDKIPTCNHAMTQCNGDKECKNLIAEFKEKCKSDKDNKLCRMENRDDCQDAWTQLKRSPMFGCICPKNSAKKKCDKFFTMINHNPCILKVIAHPDNSTTFEVIESQLENPLIDSDHQNLHLLRQLPTANIHHQRFHHRKNQTMDDHNTENFPSSMTDTEKVIPIQPVKAILRSTCHHAYTACKNDRECLTLLQPVLNHCYVASCARNECMNALQHFFKNAHHEHSLDIAFCLCKKTGNREDECIIAQEKMHPICAQRVEGVDTPTCHSLAENCREDKNCRTKLEYYEQSCSVDAITKKCAGPVEKCRDAVLGILGTELRTNCACKGTDMSQLYDCLGWHRLLKVNPCVVESQKNYHARRKHHHHPRTTTVSISSSTKAAFSIMTSMTTTTTESSDVNEEVENNIIPEVTVPPTTELTTDVWETTTSTTTTTTTTSTPSTTTTTTVPPRYCVVQRPRQSHQYIREGKGKRLYREDEPECSELCQCGEGEVLSCNTICVNSSPCKTDFAFYNHAAPAYQAYRGRCLCYSGRFICMRPSPDSYSIPHGIFMFLGYSEADQSLLRPFNNLTVFDAVSSLDAFMRQEVKNQTVCTLFLYNVTGENVIAVARLGADSPPLNSSEAQSLQHLLKVKDECVSMLEDLSDKINNKHQEVHTHPLLSIFKMAEVEVKLPHSSSAQAPLCHPLLLVLLISSILWTNFLTLPETLAS